MKARRSLVSVIGGVLLFTSLAAAQPIAAGRPNRAPSDAVRLFLLYPNYRGLIFDDWAQTLKVNVAVKPPRAYRRAQLKVVLNLLNTANDTVLSGTYPVASSADVSLDVSALADGTYQLQAVLETKSGRRLANRAPAYTIVKAPAATRTALKAYIDPSNILHYAGQAVFPVGVYDLPNPSCSDAASAWQAGLDLIRQAAISAYLPLSATDCAITDFTAQTQALNSHAMVDFPALSSTYAGNQYFPYELASSLGLFPAHPASAKDALNVASAFAKATASNGNILGYYNYDEPTDAQQPMIFNQYQTVRAADPASVQWSLINIATITWNRRECMRAPFYAPSGDPPESDPCTDVSNWRDTGDAFGTGPLATEGWNFDANGNYWLPEVADWIHDLQFATRGSRPVWAVLQYYAGEPGFPGYPHWPTYQELHDMTYIAVVAGVQGIWYWSWGNLNLPAPDGAPNPSAEIGYLDQIINGLVPLEPVILSSDAKVLAGNSQTGTIITREKAPPGGDRYLFAYNHSGVPLSATFMLAAPATSVTAIGGENRSIPLGPTGTSFTDNFGVYEAHVYDIKAGP
ncbi:MAG: hypothetical protein ABSC63_19605 [Candidatus Binataceae bacterium]